MEEGAILKEYSPSKFLKQKYQNEAVAKLDIFIMFCLMLALLGFSFLNSKITVVSSFNYWIYLYWRFCP